MEITAVDVLDSISALADPVRGRLLLALERHELAVGELSATLQLPQSTVSRHLKTLVDAGWVRARADGPSRRYHLADVGRKTPAGALWAAVREPLASLPAAPHDAERLQAVLAERRSATRAFFSSSAEAWDRLRAELFGARADLLALFALLDDDMVVGDLGCGTGAVADVLAPFVGRVIAVDHSREMLAVARRRLDGRLNVELREGDLELLPIDDATLDVALLVLTLHHLPDPAAVFVEAARVLKPSGRLVVIDMAPHDRERYRQEMGHVWLGFGEAQLAQWLADAGFGALRYTPLPVDPAARGPQLVAASARRLVTRVAARGASTASPTHITA
ncbi:ArsR family transcriptional regulator [Gemmatimonadetes bacterium T265]|nr:ArsR family transcriptional regulator [Gemmatimonadetes bacterium T265]